MVVVLHQPRWPVTDEPQLGRVTAICHAQIEDDDAPEAHEVFELRMREAGRMHARLMAERRGKPLRAPGRRLIRWLGEALEGSISCYVGNRR